MVQTKNSLERIYNGRDKLVDLLEVTKEVELSDKDREFLNSIEEEVKFFETSMENDINTADAITAVFNIVKKINTGLNENSNKK